MEHFSKVQINAMEKIYRLNLINSCTGYKSANLIGTSSDNGTLNLAVFSSITHLGSNPSLLSFIVRPTTVPRDTYRNIISNKFFSVNHIHVDDIEDAHHTSARYPSNISEFDVTNLETIYKNNFFAPFVQDCPIQIAMKFVEEYDIKSNNTKLVIGEIQELYIKDELLKDDGFINLSEGKIATINGLNGYAIPTLKERFEYQRPLK